MAFQSRSKSTNTSSFLTPNNNNYTTTNVVRPMTGDVDYNQYMNLNSQGTSVPPSQSDFQNFRNQYQVPVMQNTSRRPNDEYWTQSIPPNSRRMLQQQQQQVPCKQRQAQHSQHSQQPQQRRRKQKKKQLSSVGIFKKNIKDVTKEIFKKKNKKISLFQHIYRTCTKNNRSESLGILFIIILLMTFVILLFVYNMKKNNGNVTVEGGLTTSKTNPFKKYF